MMKSLLVASLALLTLLSNSAEASLIASVGSGGRKQMGAPLPTTTPWVVTSTAGGDESLPPLSAVPAAMSLRGGFSLTSTSSFVVTQSIMQMGWAAQFVLFPDWLAKFYFPESVTPLAKHMCHWFGIMMGMLSTIGFALPSANASLSALMPYFVGWWSVTLITMLVKRTSQFTEAAFKMNITANVIMLSWALFLLSKN